MVSLNLPLRSWVPQWLGIIVAFVIILPVSMLNGAYTGSMQEVSGTLGVLSEDITMGYYATSAGMAVAYPIVTKINTNLTPKTMLLCDLTLQAILSFLCARSTSIDLIIFLSFLIGFLKAFVMLWFISNIKKFFSPHDIRSEFYSYFFPIVFAGGQLSMALTAQLAYYYDWKYMYYFMMIMLMLAILLILICFKYARRPVYIPYKEMDFRSMLLAASSLLMAMYVLCYGKTLDWFASSKIICYTLLAPALLALLLWRQQHAEKPYVSLKPLGSWKRLLGYFYMLMIMFFSSTSTLVTNYLTTILKVDSVHTNSLCLWLLPGFALGGFICFWWFRWQRWRFRFLIAGGMFCFVIYFAILYFGVSPTSTYEMLYLPTFFRGLGMMTLIIAFGLYVAENLEFKYLLSNAFFVILFRSALSPVLGMSVCSNALYHLQQKNFYLLSESVTAADALAYNNYTSSLQSALAQGHGMSEAEQLASTSLYNTLYQQSLLLSLKEMLGILLIVTLIIAVVSRFIPFHKTVRVKVLKTGKDMI